MYKGDVEDLCQAREEEKKENFLEEDFSLVEVPSQGTDSLNYRLEQVHHWYCRLHSHNPPSSCFLIGGWNWWRDVVSWAWVAECPTWQFSQYVLMEGECNGQQEKSWPEVFQALVLLVPMRLGADALNPIYASCLKVSSSSNSSSHLYYLLDHITRLNKKKVHFIL